MKRALRKYHLILLFAAAFFIGCDPTIPDGVMEIEDMVPVVKDLQIAYAGVDATIQNPEDRPVKYEEMNTLILAKHQVDKETFFDSFSFYQHNPTLMDSIFKQVVDQINEEIVNLDKGGQPNKNRPNPPANQ